MVWGKYKGTSTLTRVGRNRNLRKLAKLRKKKNVHNKYKASQKESNQVNSGYAKCE